MTSTLIDHKGFSALVDGLNNKKNLRVLKLNFGKTQIKDSSYLIKLAKSLKNIKTLKTFSLELCETKAEDEFFDHLIEPLC